MSEVRVEKEWDIRKRWWLSTAYDNENLKEYRTETEPTPEVLRAFGEDFKLYRVEA